jgi:uncharacterized membrane protein YbhN (UPF0104 family)
MLKRWQFWAGLLISAVFLYFSLRGLKLGDVWQAMQSARYIWLLPGIAVYFGCGAGAGITCCAR